MVKWLNEVSSGQFWYKNRSREHKIRKISNRWSRSLENTSVRQLSIEGVLRFWNIFYRGSFLYDNVSLWYRWRKVVLPRVAKRRLDSKKHAAMTISKRQNLVKVAMCCSLRTWYRWRSFPRGRKDDWIAERRGLITRLQVSTDGFNRWS